MKDKIKRALNKIETEEKISILYACESGSRAWGFDSKDSDFDIRFIYYQPITRYHTIFPNIVLDSATKETCKTVKNLSTEVLDFAGHDIKKTLYLISKGNPDIISWLYSPTIYVDGKWISCLRKVASEFFKSKSGIYHYEHMARQNFNQYINNKNNLVSIKKYLYVLRPIVACMWIEEYQTAPPMIFEDLLYAVKKEISDSIYEEILYIIKRKKSGEELKLSKKIPKLDIFCEQKLDYFRNKGVKTINNHSREYNKLDKLFHEIITN